MTKQAQHDPGGKVLIPLPLWVRGDWVVSKDHIYRYELSRVWDENLPVLLLIMMNPSTASKNENDPSVAKCMRYAEDWGYGTLLVGNGFAYRATDHKQLGKVADPIGPENDKHLLRMAERADTILFAYGQPSQKLRFRGPQVASMLAESHLSKFHVLELALDGTPKHPLYLKGSLKPIPWKFQTSAAA